MDWSLFAETLAVLGGGSLSKKTTTTSRQEDDYCTIDTAITMTDCNNVNININNTVTYE